MTVNPDLPTPLYVQVADVLRTEIKAGQIVGRVPSVKTLMQRFEVAQGTCERALTILRKEGLIVSVQGRGHFTVPPDEGA